MMELIHMTAVYSNAMLVAILPQVSDCAKKLDLPVPQPITASQVIEFRPSPYKGEIGGGLMLSNHYWFSYADGHVMNFRSPDNMFGREDLLENWKHFAGKENMTTNQAIDMARDALRRLGYNTKELGLDQAPTSVQCPFDFQGHHIPQFQMVWDTGEQQTNSLGEDLSVHVTFDINLDKKSFTGMTLIGRTLRQSPPKVDVDPELESDFQKRSSIKLFVRTNAPPTLTHTAAEPKD
jgi:hypothetical protein